MTDEESPRYALLVISKKRVDESQQVWVDEGQRFWVVNVPEGWSTQHQAISKDAWLDNPPPADAKVFATKSAARAFGQQWRGDGWCRPKRVIVVRVRARMKQVFDRWELA